MSFIDNILQKPTYGWSDNQGELVKPTRKELFSEAFRNVNIFRSRKNWISLISWAMVLCMLPMFYVFIRYYFSWQLCIAIVVYAMTIMGTHGTVWFHRYCTHKAYKFRSPVFRFITQNLV